MDQGSTTGLPTTGTLLLGPLCTNFPDSIMSLVQGTIAVKSLDSHVHATLVRILTLCQVDAIVTTGHVGSGMDQDPERQF